MKSKIENSQLMDGEDYIHPKLLKTLSRRQALTAIGGLTGLFVLSSCSKAADFSSVASGDSSSPNASDGTAPETCSVIPSETEGPYPASTMLDESWIARADIREDRTGIPVLMTLNLVDTNNACAPISNAAIYIWHCDKDGSYSGYGSAVSDTFLRGVQTSNSAGQVSFQTVFPGWYSGRITHIHFEVFLNNDLNSKSVKISQIAFPQAITQAAYASALYKSRGQNTSVPSFMSDMVFRDGVQSQLATVTGDVSSGYVAQLDVGLAL
jgi:protocatechuate 3,4-dioxygenase beta subunit